MIVLIPAYNASHTIAEVVFKTIEFVEAVIVYDDGSTDDTSYIAKKCGAIVLREEKNRGKGYALKKLFDYAKEMLSRHNPIVVTLDADMQHNPRDIPKLVEPIKNNEADIVIGVRKGMPKHRIIPNKILDFFSNKSVQSQSGFRAYRFETIYDLKLEEEGFGVDSEILMQLSQKWRVKTVVIEQQTDKYSHTKNPISHFMEVFNFLFLQRPLLNLGIIGTVGFVLGLFEIVQVIRSWNLTGDLAVGTFLFGMLCIILGAFTFFTGVILHVIKRKS